MAGTLCRSDLPQGVIFAYFYIVQHISLHGQWMPQNSLGLEQDKVAWYLVYITCTAAAGALKSGVIYALETTPLIIVQLCY